MRRELLTTWEPYKLRPVSDELPDRWETGTQSHEALAGTIAAIAYIADAGGFDAFAAHERALTTRFLEGLARIPTVRLIGIADPARANERTPTFAASDSSRRAAPYGSASAITTRPRRSTACSMRSRTSRVECADDPAGYDGALTPPPEAPRCAS